MNANKLVVEARWDGAHGIGRFSREVIHRLRPGFDIITGPPSPSSPIDPFVLDARLRFHGTHAVYFSPSYNAPASRRARALLTLHDLMHLTIDEESSRAKRAYYHLFVRPAVRYTGQFCTVSRFSANMICEWAGLPEEAAVVVGNAASASFRLEGAAAKPGYRYVLYVGNFLQHKNLPLLLKAFSMVNRVHSELRLVLVRPPDRRLIELAAAFKIHDQLVFLGAVDDPTLAGLYRGASVVAVPSLMEGFGMPALEAMACGTPVVAAKAGALPEVCGDAAHLVDPHDPDDLAHALLKLIEDREICELLRSRGLQNVRRFSWDTVAGRVQFTLDSILN